MSDTQCENIVVVGSSGHAKVAIDIIEREGKRRIVGLLDAFRSAGESACGYRILGREEDLPALVRREKIQGGFIAVGDNWKRFQVVRKILALLPDFVFISAIHPSAEVARGVTIGRGSVLMPGAIVNTESRIGEFVIVNTKASLDHDCVMEEFSSLAPNATAGGSVRIGAFSAVCLGANIVHKRRIGKHTVIGAGALVLEDIPDFCVAYGVPARIARKRSEGEEYL